MKQFLLLLLVSSFSCALSAQTISGVIIDADTSEPLGYANVGIQGKPLGTVADAAGNYTLNLKPEHEADTVCFSLIGYETAKFAAADLIAGQSADAALKRATYQIDDVVITSSKWRRQKFGDDFASSAFSTGTRENSSGFEFGSLFKFRKRARLESVSITVRDCTCDSMIFRINVYEQGPDGRDFVNIQTKPIYFQIERTSYSEDGMTIITIDIADHNIITQGNTIVAIEQIETGLSGTVTFPVSFMGNKQYFRLSKQYGWAEEILRLPIQVTVWVER